MTVGVGERAWGTLASHGSGWGQNSRIRWDQRPGPRRFTVSTASGLRRAVLGGHLRPRMARRLTSAASSGWLCALPTKCSRRWAGCAVGRCRWPQKDLVRTCCLLSGYGAISLQYFRILSPSNVLVSLIYNKATLVDPGLLPGHTQQVNNEWASREGLPQQSLSVAVKP